MTKIFLSPSDQFENKYAYGSTNEAVQCRKIADACEVALKRCGFTVKNSKDNSYVNRTKESNTWDADLHVCIHSNAFNSKVDGLRMFYYDEGGPSYNACKAIYETLVKIVPGVSNNMKSNQELYEMYYTNCASVYCEVSFHDVASTAKWIIENTTKIGETIAQGICKYYGVEYKSVSINNVATSGEMYRIRKSWTDVKSQIGAYKNLENAKKVCPSGYYVFNNAGSVVYPIVSNPSIDYAQSFDKSKAGTYTVVPKEGLHLRNGASTNKTSLEVLEQGTVVTCYGYYSGQWYLVQTSQGRTGYVCSEYLK